MFCSNCGSDLYDGTMLCPVCGQQFIYNNQNSNTQMNYTYPENTEMNYTQTENTQKYYSQQENAQMNYTYPENAQMNYTYPENAQMNYTYPENTEMNYTYPENAQMNYTYPESEQNNSTQLDNQNSKKVKNKKMKKEKSNKKSCIIGIIACLIFVLCIFGVITIVRFINRVEFSNYAVEMAVRDALDKEPGDIITEKDLLDVEELLIDKRYASTRLNLSGGFYDSINLDLTDVALLKNLKKLVIDNDDYDSIYCINAIEQCKNLEYLQINLLQSMTCGQNMSYGGDYNEVNFCGYNVLSDIVCACDKLTYLNTEDPLPNYISEQLMLINNNLQLDTIPNNNSKKRGFDTSLDEYLATNPTFIQGSFSNDELVRISKCDTIERIHVFYGGEEFDLSKVSNMKNLKSLAISGGKQRGKIATADIVNFNDIKKMKQLTSLSLNYCTIDGDIKNINKIDNLKQLSVELSNIDLPHNMKCFKNLVEFEVNCYNITDVDMEKYLDNMPKLSRFKCYGLEDIGQIKNATNLKSLSFHYTGNDSTLMLSELNNLKNVRKINIYCYPNSVIDCTGYIRNHNLDTINLYADCKNINDLGKCENLRAIDTFICRYENSDFANGNTIDMSLVAQLPHLSYFGIWYEDLFRSEIYTLSELVGLKMMIDNGVIIDSITYYLDEGYGINDTHYMYDYLR